MKYLSPKDIKSEKQALEGAWNEGGGTDMVVRGKSMDLLLKYTNKYRSVLDVGCGNGLFAEMLINNEFSSIFGFDIDDYIGGGRRSIFQELAFGDISYEKFPWADSFFDAVCAWQVIEHLENPHHFIREVYRVLKPGGIFFLSTPNIFHIFNKYAFLRSGDMPRWKEKNNHIALFPKGVFNKTVLKYFDLVERGFCKGELPYRFFRKFKFPENEWFGKSVYYVLRKKN